MPRDALKKPVIVERGERIEGDLDCEGAYCQLLFGPIDDLVMMKTAMITVEKENVEKLLVEAIVILAKILARYQLQEAKQ